MTRLEEFLEKVANPRLALPAGLFVSDPPVIAAPTRDGAKLRLLAFTGDELAYVIIEPGNADYWRVDTYTPSPAGMLQLVETGDVLSTDEIIERLGVWMDYVEGMMPGHSEG